MLNIYLNDLPNTVHELVQTVGIEAAWKLIEARGGLSLTVPKHAHKDHWIYLLIGEKSFQSLVEMYQGEEIEIPLCATAKRRAVVAGFLLSGKSISSTASRCGLTRRGVRKIREVLKAQGRLN